MRAARDRMSASLRLGATHVHDVPRSLSHVSLPMSRRKRSLAAVFATAGILPIALHAAAFADASSVDRLPSIALLTSAAGADLGAGVEEAAFRFFAAQARFQIDRQVYPPTGKGGDHPGVLVSALRATLGPRVLQALEAEPDAYSKVVDRLQAWTPAIDSDYSPGWEHTGPIEPAAATKAVNDVKAAILGTIRQQAIRLQDQSYRALTQELAAAKGALNRASAALDREAGLVDRSSPAWAEYQRLNAACDEVAGRVRDREWEIDPESRWHRSVGWEAADYFSDPAVVELCEAIERNDLAAMRVTIAAGADVNAVGRDGMTPLLWAFPEGKLDRFVLLLQNGADPNVRFKSDFGIGYQPFHPHPSNRGPLADNGCHAGLTVTHLACRSRLTPFFEAVFAHGGDPNLTDGKTGQAPLDLVLARDLTDQTKRVETLLERGADPGRFCDYNRTYPVLQAVRNQLYVAAARLVRAGADPLARLPPSGGWQGQPRLGESAAHVVLRHEEYLPFTDASKGFAYEALVSLLGRRRVDFAGVRAELDRGPAWGMARRRQEDRKTEARRKEKREEELRRRAALKRLHENPAPEQKSASELLAMVTESQRERLILPEDPDRVVLSIEQFGRPTPGADAAKPWLIAYADGRVEVRGSVLGDAPAVAGRIERDELLVLLHLAVNECGLLEKQTKDYAEHASPRRGGFRFTVATAAGSNELELPFKTLVVKRLRADLGLFPFKPFTTRAREVANRVVLETEGPSEAVLRAVHDELRRQHPEIPPFRLNDVTSASKTADGRLVVSLVREFDYGNDQYERVSCHYSRGADEPKIRVNRLRFSR